MSQLTKIAERLLGKDGVKELVMHFVTGNFEAALDMLRLALVGKLSAGELVEAKAAIATLKRLAKKALGKGG